MFVVDAVFSYLKVFGNLQKICRGKNTFTDMLMRIFIEISSYNRYFSSRCQLMYAFSDSLSYLVIISYCLAREIAPPRANHNVKHSFLFLFPFDFFVLFETCQPENLCNVSMQIISPSKWVEGKNLVLKFLVCHLFFSLMLA